jgi:hypothetical protein
MGNHSGCRQQPMPLTWIQLRDPLLLLLREPALLLPLAAALVLAISWRLAWPRHGGLGVGRCPRHRGYVRSPLISPDQTNVCRPPGSGWSAVPPAACTR